MRLADFILENVEPILVEWEAFAHTVWPGPEVGPSALRDHAKDILRATAWDMKSLQTDEQRSGKSQGEGDDGKESLRVDNASDVHAIARVHSGFDLLSVVAEYRALRASVIRLWRESAPSADRRDLEDLTRFNESIDQGLTEAIRSYTKLVEGSRQMFLSILGHDLRNPLSSIILSAELVSATSPPGSEGSKMGLQITRSASAMAGMIGDLLDFTGSELGATMPLSPAAMDLNILAREVIEEMRSAHPARTLSYQAQGELTGEWDAARVRQVLSNLLGNALQHGDDAGTVQLSIAGDATDVVMSVRNGGPPIPPDALPTIFDPLARGFTPELQKKRRPGSIGLGLYIVREVVVGHGGSIDVTSSAEAGTEFTVRLPRRRPSASQVARADSHPMTASISD
jgi:signal transduction histidine kinase